MMMLGNRVLRKAFGSKREEATEDWRKIHNEKLHDLYSSPTNIRVFKLRKIRWVGHVTHTTEKRNAYRILVWKPEGKK